MDVLQETYRRLLDPRLERFVASRGRGNKYVRGVILNAINFAGRRRRRKQEEARPGADVEEPSTEVVDIGWQEPLDLADARIDLQWLLRRADPVAVRAVKLVCRDGLSQRDAARIIGVSEFKLSRTFRRLSGIARQCARHRHIDAAAEATRPRYLQ